MISQNSSIKELYLHWNRLKEAVNFLEVVGSSNLKVLDLGNNSLGQASNIAALAEVFVKNEELVHLDLSFNQFDLEQTEALSKALSQNHTIYGFHF